MQPEIIQLFYNFGKIQEIMGDHSEPKENEIGGPVLVALIVITLIVLFLYFLG